MKKFEESEESKILERALLALPIDEEKRKIILSCGKMLYLSGQYDGLLKFENSKDLKKIKEV